MQTQTSSSDSRRPASLHALQPAPATQVVDELLQAFGPQRHFARHQYLFRAGESCGGIYLIEKGSVKVSTLSPNGDEQIVCFGLPGELLGLEALGQASHNSSAVALEPTHVRALSLPALHALYQRSPGLSHRLLQLISRRIAVLHEHMLMLGQKTAAERLASFLMDLTTRTQMRDLTLSMSRDALGCYLGITLETVSRLLHKFEKEKLIVLQGRRVRLIEPARLRLLAEGTCARAA